LEGSGTVSSADLGDEDEGVAAVEVDGWLDEDGSLRVRHMIFGEIPYPARLCLCLCLAFDRLLEFLFVRFFSFSFLSCYFVWVLSMHSSRGEIEDHVWFEDQWMVASLGDE
jgi:hypothetical protein